MNRLPTTVRRPKLSMKLTLLTILTFVLALGLHYGIFQRYRVGGALFSQLLYLPSGKYLKHASFGYHGLLADYIYIWSIQYYGDPGFHPRMEYLQHTYDIITDLDPQYIDAYQVGALFMFYEERNPRAGLQLLDKGMANNPSEWILPTDAAFYCMMNLKNNKKAAYYFERASKLPGAPSFVKRMLAGTHFRLGDKRQAHLLWKEVYETAERPTIKQTAFQHMQELQVLINLEDLRKGLNAYSSTYGRYPLNLYQLVSSHLLPAIPFDPHGDPYEYDPETGAVKYSKRLITYKKFE